MSLASRLVKKLVLPGAALDLRGWPIYPNTRRLGDATPAPLLITEMSRLLYFI
jgi:hypothetical protein